MWFYVNKEMVALCAFYCSFVWLSVVVVSLAMRSLGADFAFSGYFGRLIVVDR